MSDKKVVLDTENKSLLFTVLEFIHETELNEQDFSSITNFVEAAQSGKLKDQMFSGYQLIKTISGPIAKHEDEFDRLFAKLGNVDVEVIKSLSVSEYIGLFVDFFTADSFKSVFESVYKPEN